MITNLFSSMSKEKCKTITPDRGQEFSKHTQFSQICGLGWYFADPWSPPWHRGTNENTNGLIREYLPKRRDMTPVSEEYIESVVHKLNHRPRKYLDWKTLHEVFYDKELRLVLRG